MPKSASYPSVRKRNYAIGHLSLRPDHQTELSRLVRKVALLPDTALCPQNALLYSANRTEK